MRAAREAQDVKARIAALAGFPTGTTPEEFEWIYARDLPVREKAVKASGAKID